MKSGNEVYVGGSRLTVDPKKAIGKGGEADVYDIGNGMALKVYKPPSHPDFQLDPDARKGAGERIAEQQRKLPAFPANLPQRVITPEHLAYDAPGGSVVGYTMRYMKGMEVLLRYADRSFRESGGIGNNDVTEIFKRLHPTVAQLHAGGVVMGDFNDLNVLVRKDFESFIIDADSFQFGQFLCRVFTARFVDPLVCDPKADRMLLAKPYTMNSDWYAFAVMLMQCFLYVDPYGGLYRPKDPAKRIGHTVRPLHRVTVFHPEVRYPKPARPYGVLPDDLLQYFHRTFEQDLREAFPIVLLESIRWTTCNACGTEYARSKCPACFQAAPGSVKETTVIRGTVTATRFFWTAGTILCAAFQGAKLRFLYLENGEFKREDGSTALSGGLDPNVRFRIRGPATLFGKQNQIAVLEPGKPPERLSVDAYGQLPVFDANGDHVYWIQSGRLYRNGQYASDYIGDVLAGQTLVWAGPSFGFGLYRAGNLSVAFVFDARLGGINDGVKLPPITGQLFDSTAVFAKDKCWFLAATQIEGRIINRCSVIGLDGSVEATAEAEQGDGSWLGSGIRGKCAIGHFLLAPTDDGIVRVEASNGGISVTKSFPDTEPFVDASSQLFPGTNGLHIVGRQDIQLIKIQ